MFKVHAGCSLYQFVRRIPLWGYATFCWWTCGWLSLGLSRLKLLWTFMYQCLCGLCSVLWDAYLEVALLGYVGGTARQFPKQSSHFSSPAVCEGSIFCTSLSPLVVSFLIIAILVLWFWVTRGVAHLLMSSLATCISYSEKCLCAHFFSWVICFLPLYCKISLYSLIEVLYLIHDLQIFFHSVGFCFTFI